MTARALNSRNQNVLAARLEIADNMFTRMKGLMGRKEFGNVDGLLIKRSGNSIHTFFMRFALDLIYIDSTGQVRWLEENMKPWRVSVARVLSSTDCLELPAGTISKTQTQIGDIIHVES